MFSGLISAVRTLTAIPCPGREAADAAAGLPWYPIVGALLGGVLYGLGTGAQALVPGGWAQGTAALLVVAGILLTRGLHLDGLADWADGFWGGWNREQTLRIMKDSHVGTFGALALVTVILAKWVALQRLVGLGMMLWIVPAYPISRMSVVGLAYSLPYARPEGGTGGAPVRGARLSHYAVAIFSAAFFSIALCGPRVAALLVAGWFVSLALSVWFRYRIGGVTGDLLGATSELVETAVLVLSAAGGDRLLAFGRVPWVVDAVN